MMVEQIKDISRRGFFGVAAAAALLVSPLRRLRDGVGGGAAGRAGAGGGGGAAPQVDYATLEYGLTGGWTPDGFLVTCQFDPVSDAGKPIRLAVSSTQDMSNIVAIVGPVTSDSDALARFPVTGLPELAGVVTQYFCQAMEPSTTTLFGEVFGGWTRMSDVEADYSFDIVLGSCLSGGEFVGPYGSQKALCDAADLNAPLLLHLGDWGYWGQSIKWTDGDDYTKDLGKYITSMNHPALTQLRRLVHGANIEACISDHELHNNGDGITDPQDPDYDGDAHGAYECPHTIRQMTAHKKLFPVAVWGDGASGTSHRGYYIDLAPHVRLVVSDFRSPQRDQYSDGTGDQDPDNTQMWGADQETWLFEDAFDVDEHTVILFVNETAWWRRATGDNTEDKPASYLVAQGRFMDRLKGTGAYAGYPPIIDRFVWLGGDRHYCGYLSRSDATDGFPQFIGSGFCKNSLMPKQQEDMTWRSPVRSDRFAWFPVVGYMKLTLSYDHTTSTVTLSGVGRIVESTHRQRGDGSVTDGSTTITTVGDCFHDDDTGKLISGRYIPKETEGSDEMIADPDTPPTTISSVQGPTEATMTAAATGSSDTITFCISSDPGSWMITSHPTATPTTETFQV